jgi:hypothetical protein
MQWRMIATVVETSRQVQADLLPFGQAQAFAKVGLHPFGIGFEFA